MHVCMNERVRWHNFQTCESTRSRRDEWDVWKCMQSNVQRHTDKSVAKVHSGCFQKFQQLPLAASALLLIVLASLCMNAISKQFRFQFLILPSSSVDEFSCQIPMNHKKALCHLSTTARDAFMQNSRKISSIKRPLSCRCRSRHKNKWQQMLIIWEAEWPPGCGSCDAVTTCDSRKKIFLLVQYWCALINCPGSCQAFLIYINFILDSISRRKVQLALLTSRLLSKVNVRQSCCKRNFIRNYNFDNKMMQVTINQMESNEQWLERL